MTYGRASFHHYGPHLWNSLPESLRAAETVEVFKGGLKTHLFNMVFRLFYQDIYSFIWFYSSELCF